MLLYFATTLFVSAFLLFLVQPMVGKMILPSLGGTPAVWNTCMVFFQAILLVGYGYTHTVSGWRNRKLQLGAQMAILILPLATLLLPTALQLLPFRLGDWTPPETDNPVFAVLWLLLGMVGLPFFVVTTSAPLLQKWFADTGHPASKDPYFLYGASNLGSMLALIFYPLVVEHLGLDDQVWVWTFGYALLTALMAGCVIIVWKTKPVTEIQLAGVPAASESVAPSEPLHLHAQPVVEPQSAIQSGRKVRRRASSDAMFPVARIDAERPITWGRRLRWVLLAAAPSSLMLGATTHLTTDIAAIPFFWVIPLALYLMTFILVFARWPVVWTDMPHTVVLYVQPFVLGGLMLMQAGRLVMPAIWMDFALHVAVFFLTALMCHGEFARDRPSTRYLTEFYLMMSLGGVLGGLFNALFAPMVFWFGIVEYPIAMIVSCMLRPNLLGDKAAIPGDTTSDERTTLGMVFDFAVPALIGLWIWVLLFFVPPWNFYGKPVQIYAKALTVVLVLAMFCRPIRFSLALGAFVAVAASFDWYNDGLVFERRSFFGLVRARETTINSLDDKVGTFNELQRLSRSAGYGNRLIAKDAIERETDEDFIKNKLKITYRTLVHGGINHGQQMITADPVFRRLPTTYFHPKGGIGQIFEKFNTPNMRMHDVRMAASMIGLGASPFDPWGALVNTQSEPPFAVMGLGIGTLAAHARPYQYMRFYEIDPLVKRMSDPPTGEQPVFFYYRDAEQRHANIDIVIGDGRLSLKKRAPANYYHILVLDAFSSDAIPMHLLTKEAVMLYLDRIAEGGILIFNTTNRYVDLTGPLRDLANDKDINCNCYHFGDYGDGNLHFATDWVILQRKNIRPESSGGPLMSERFLILPQGADEKAVGWRQLLPVGGQVWDDRYSNLFRAMRWGQ